MRYYRLLFLSILLLQCSSQESFRTESTESLPASHLVNEAAIPPSVDGIPGPGSDSPVSNTHSPISLTADTVKSRTALAPKDTLEPQQLYISQRLEDARLHYLAALAAQDAGDSTRCADEFEMAIAA